MSAIWDKIKAVHQWVVDLVAAYPATAAWVIIGLVILKLV